MNPKKEVVLVTGSSGCLGQFIVKHLQEQDDNVEEIRLYDRHAFKNKLGYREDKRMVEYHADIRNPNMLLEAMEGVDCVIHAAALIDLRVLANKKALEVNNIEGTKAVIDACLRKNVPRLVFASATDVVCGTEHIFYASESTAPIPTSFMLGKYAETKCRAEELILKANGQLCDDGETVLRTVSLRPTPFYGENDKFFFTYFLTMAKVTNNVYHRIRSLDERLQISYVGNVAWAFVKAKEKLAEDETIAGEAFFITDDTPIIDIHEQVQPYIEARGGRLHPFIYPYWLAWIIFALLNFVIKFINIFWKYDDDKMLSIHTLNYMCSTFFFNRSKATLRLDYEPIYTPEEARERSLPYYTNAVIP